jgi:butyryl-CoA dehydrogenase
LHEVLETEKLRRLQRFEDYDAAAIDMAIDAAKQIGDTYLFPICREMDAQKLRFESGKVYTHPGLRVAIRALADGGWIAANADHEEGGQQMPWTLMQACLFIFYAANANAASYAFLTQSAAGLIRVFGNEALNDTYVPPMLRGEWQGTMALTEPQAGSSLTDITTVAQPSGEGYFLIKGQKIFISGGDHDAMDNIVHLLLAKIEGAPPGVKGISLFVVPKLRPEGSSLVPNDVSTAGVFPKMGQKGYVAAHLMLGESDDCRGWLVGAPHQGLAQMFRMMNEARIGTGNMAAGTASAAYYASLDYARQRTQGRHPSEKDPAMPPVPIIDHADVRRMLLFQKAVVEGSISLLLQCSYYADLVEASTGEEREHALLLLELLTPVAKSYPAETGIHAVSAGMQVLGGAGYTEDFPLEQYYRDIRVNAIYEGTTGIHGLDLLGRKLLLAKGKAFRLFVEEVEKTAVTGYPNEVTSACAGKLFKSGKTLHEVSLHLIDLALNQPQEVFLADATLYLEMFGLVAIGWQWLKQGIVATGKLETAESETERNFYEGKLAAMRYFFEYENPKVAALERRLRSDDRTTLNLKPEWLD